MDLSALSKELVFVGAVALILLVTAWDYLNRRRKLRVEQPVADVKGDGPYTVYTREFDLTLMAEDVPGRLQDASDDVFKGKSDWSGKGWQQRVENAKRWLAEHPQPMDMAQRFAAAMRAGGIGDPADVAVTVLVDQSASMKGDPMSAVFAAVAGLEGAITRAGARMEILGFSTAGWDGGFARKKWLAEGRPARPGRLSALLHIVYKEHGDPEWRRASREAMLHPDILRENIDGEALEWAASRLRETAAGTRLLIVISDGPAEDDTTVMHNGKAYLERHLVKTIAAIESEGAIRLGALGVKYDVSRQYRHNRNGKLDSLPEDLLALAMELAAGGRAQQAEAAA
jgi:cobaltochelatase CobT